MKFPLTPSAGLAPAALAAGETHAIAQFLFQEARLLDEDRWAAWLSLFTEDGMYWVPLTPGQADPLNHVSLFWENALLREVRVKRITNPRNWSQQPHSRSSRLLGNVMIDGMDPEYGDIVVSSRFQFTEWRKDEQRTLAGTYRHHLARQGDSYRIRLKHVDLVNSEAVHQLLQVFI